MLWWHDANGMLPFNDNNNNDNSNDNADNHNDNNNDNNNVKEKQHNNETTQ